MIGLESYGGRRKQSHRGWAFNRLLERLDVPVASATGLALLGPTPREDTAKLRSIGVTLQNVTAVDTDGECVAASRKLGVPSVQSDLQTTLECWNDRPLDFIYWDGCRGIDTAMELLAASIVSHALRAGTVIYLNMQRGRDDSSLLELLRRFPSVGNKEKHRGRMAFSIAECDYYHCLGLWFAPKSLVDETRSYASPVFDTYGSDSCKSLKMDSVCFRWLRGPLEKVVDWSSVDSDTAPGRLVRRTRRSLAALKANRTRRLACK